MAEPSAAMGTLTSMPRLLDRNAKEFGARSAYREKDLGIWQSWTWSEAKDQVDALALGFLEFGVDTGDHVAVIGRNRPALYWAMLAAQRIGAVPVPLYQDAASEEIGWVLEHCGARFVVAGDQEQVDKILESAERLPHLARVIYLDPKGMRSYDHPLLVSYGDAQDIGRRAQGHRASELRARSEALSEDHICVMLYTSGTTGRPKGVVLSNRNIIDTSRASAGFDGLHRGEEVLAYLPMAWVGDYIFSMGQALWCGFCVNCPEAADTVSHDMREIGPTYYFAPPRVFESQLTQVMIRMEDAGGLKRWMFHHALALAKRVGPRLLDGAPVSVLDRLRHKLADLTVLGPLKNTLGLSRVRVGYTAGEAIGPELFEFYRALGINLKQLYGQTEASVFITQQRDGEVRSDTVGTPTPGVELKIAESGEVFYRSPGSFQRYFKNDAATRETKDAEGWVATGDAGFIEADSGHLRIIDRAKDVGKMADGTLFAPKYVENKLKFFPDVLEAVVLGKDRPYCTAILNIDLTAVGNWAERNNIGYASYQDLAGLPHVLDIMDAHMRVVNDSLASDAMLSGCQVHRFLVLHKELDADDGELTRTRKVRRRIIEEKYADLVNALYDGSQTVSTQTEVTYEDGRKGSISATLTIRDVIPAQTHKVAAQ